MKTRFILIVCLICLTSCRLSFFEELAKKIEGSGAKKDNLRSPPQERRPDHKPPHRPDHHRRPRSPVKRIIKIAVISVLSLLAVVGLIVVIYKKFNKTEKKAKKAKKTKKGKKTAKSTKKAKKAVWSMPEEDEKEEKVFIVSKEPVEVVEPDFKVIEQREVEHPEIESTEPVFVPKAFALAEDSEEEVSERDDKLRKLSEIEAFVAEKEKIMAMSQINMEEMTVPQVYNPEYKVETFVSNYPSLEEYKPRKAKNPFN